jgi:hypothetical protein
MQARKTTIVIAICVAFALLAIGALLFVPRTFSFGLDRAGGVALVEIVLLLIMSVAPPVWRFRKAGIEAVTEPLCVMSAAFLLYYAFRGLLLLLRHSLSRPDAMLRLNPASNSDLAIALAYVIAGFCMFHIGYKFWNPPARNRRIWPTWSTKKLEWIAAVALTFAGISTVIAIRVSGGLGSLMTNFGCLRVVTAGYGYALLGLSYWSIAFAFLLWDRLGRGKNILAPLLVLGMANVCDAFFGNRTGVLATWATGFFIFVYSSRGQKIVRSAILCIAVLAGGIGIILPMAHVRQTFCLVPASTASSASASSSSQTSPALSKGSRGPLSATAGDMASKKTKSMTDMVEANRDYWTTVGSNLALGVLREFVALDSFSTIIAAGPNQFPFRYGGTYVDTVLFVIPRSLWPAKPRSFSFAVGQYLFGLDTDIPPGYIGELYINFHVVGIIVGMYLMGLLLRRVNRWMLSGDPVALAAYSVLAPYLIIFMGRSFIGAGTLMLILSVLMLPVIYFLRRPAPRDRGETPLWRPQLPPDRDITESVEQAPGTAVEHVAGERSI